MGKCELILFHDVIVIQHELLRKHYGFSSHNILSHKPQHAKPKLKESLT